MLRKSAAFAPRYRKFESISLQRGVRCELTFQGAPIFAGSRRCVFELTTRRQREVLRLANGGGSIVNLSSIAGIIGR
jgi:hypothetical protein